MVMRLQMYSDPATNFQRAGGFERALVQLSDGTLVWLAGGDTDGSGWLRLRGSSNRSTINITGPSLTALGTLSSYGLFSMCRDASDNLYVIGTQSGSNVSMQVQVLIKGAGYTWTVKKSASFDFVSALGPGAAKIMWCNTGGGTNGGGHLLVTYMHGNAANSAKVNVFDAGALLANADNSVAPGAQQNLFGGAQTQALDAAADGFGATSGLACAVYNPGTPELRVDQWSVSSSGVLTRTALTTETTSVAGTQGSARVVRYASGAFAIVYADSATANRYRCSRYSLSARLTAGVASGAPTNMPLVSATAPGVGTSAVWEVQNDPSTANQIRVLAQDQLGKVWAVTVSLATGVTWGTTATAETGQEASTQVFRDGIRAITNPEYSGTPQNGDWQIYTSVSSTTGFLFNGDWHSYAAAPFAPTLTAPVNTAYVDAVAGVTFAWTYNPGGTSGAQNAWALRQKVSGAGSYVYWNAGTNAWQSGIVWNTGAATSVTISTGLSNGTIYNWSVATQENGSNLQGPFAADSVFTAQAPPATTVTAPSGTITTTSTPTITWSNTLPGGAAQTAYQVIVESGAYGTTPGSGTTVWSSGTVASATTSTAVPSANHLTNGITYRFFVRVTETGGQTSAWSYSTATVTLTPPTTPTLAVTAQPSSGRVKVDVTAGAGGPGGTYYLIERSSDAGATWTYVRAASPLTPLTYGATATAYDYEAPSSQALLYRVTTVISTAGNLVYSAPSATAAVTLTLTSAWLKDPTNPARNVALSCLDNIAPARTRGASVLQPLGAKYPIVQVDARRSRTFSVDVTPATQAEADAIDVLLDDTAEVLLLQRPPASASWRGVNIYVVASGNDTSTALGDVPVDTTTISFDVTEVATPALV